MSSIAESFKISPDAGCGTVVTGSSGVVVATSGGSFLQDIKKIDKTNATGIKFCNGLMCIVDEWLLRRNPDAKSRP